MWHVPRLGRNPAGLNSGDSFELLGGVACGVITGGLGGLGLLAAEVLVGQGGAWSIALWSRSGRVPPGEGLEDLLGTIQQSHAGATLPL